MTAWTMSEEDNLHRSINTAFCTRNWPNNVRLFENVGVESLFTKGPIGPIVVQLRQYFILICILNDVRFRSYALSHTA